MRDKIEITGSHSTASIKVNGEEVAETVTRLTVGFDPNSRGLQALAKVTIDTLNRRGANRRTTTEYFAPEIHLTWNEGQ
jgi:hypothetical protein